MSYEANDLLLKLTPNSLTYFILVFGFICCALIIFYMNINPITRPLVIVNGKPNIIYHILSYLIKYSYVFAILLLIYYLNSYRMLDTYGFLIGFNGLLVRHSKLSGTIYRFFFFRNTPFISIGLFLILRETIINNYFEIRRNKQNLIILKILSFYIYFMLLGELEGFFGYVRVGYGEKVLSYTNVTGYYIKFMINVVGFISSVLLHILYNNQKESVSIKSRKNFILKKNGIFNILFISLFITGFINYSWYYI